MKSIVSKVKNAFVFLIIFNIIKTLESVEIGDTKSFSIKFKSIKCISNKPEYLKFKFCYVKPVSRSVSTINVGFQLFEDFSAPSEVRTCNIEIEGIILTN